MVLLWYDHCGMGDNLSSYAPGTIKQMDICVHVVYYIALARIYCLFYSEKRCYIKPIALHNIKAIAVRFCDYIISQPQAHSTNVWAIMIQIWCTKKCFGVYNVGMMNKWEILLDLDLLHVLHQIVAQNSTSHNAFFWFHYSFYIIDMLNKPQGSNETWVRYRQTTLSEEGVWVTDVI